MRAGREKEEGLQKRADQEQAVHLLAVVPLLKGEPAVNRGECEAPVDSYNCPLKAQAMWSFFSSCMGHQCGDHTSETRLVIKESVWDTTSTFGPLPFFNALLLSLSVWVWK